LAGIIDKLFGSRKQVSLDTPTVPSPEIQDESYEPEILLQEASGLNQFVVGCAQSVGKQRKHNEDAFFTLTTNIASDQDQMPIGLYVVADGMGGHKYGEKASGIAVRTLSTQILRKVFMPLLSPQPSPPDESLQEIMKNGVREAHRGILKDAPGGGTTLTSVLIVGEQMTITHIGDSRVYSVTSDGAVEVLTRDHSLVMRMIELGQLTVEEAAVHPQRNVLYRALGQGEPFEPDISTSPLPQAAYLLLCSDGLWGVVPEDEIIRLITTAPNMQQASQDLIDAANEAGGPDNITAVLVQLPD
jgi:serine/threonine protein phosphatase PrpC